MAQVRGFSAAFMRFPLHAALRRFAFKALSSLARMNMKMHMNLTKAMRSLSMTSRVITPAIR